MSCLASLPAIFAATLVASAVELAQVPSADDLAVAFPGLAYIVVFGTLAAILAWNAGIRRLGPLSGVLFINLVPVTAFAIGLWRGERFTAAELVGAGVVIAAIVVNNIQVRRALRVRVSTATA